MILVIDTETTGKPNTYDKLIDNYKTWPRLVQVSWIMYKNNGLKKEEKSYIVKPVGFVIPDEATKIHNISNSTAEVEGTLISVILDELEKDINKCEIIVAHNVDFDQKVIDSEFLRLGRETILEDKELLCTMVGSTEYCAILSKNGYKWPSLTELYYKLFKEEFEDAHNSLTDVRVCAKCFWKLIDEEILSHERIYIGPFAKSYRNFIKKDWKEVYILFFLMSSLSKNKDSRFNWQKDRNKAASISPELIVEVEKISEENAQLVAQQYIAAITDLVLINKSNVITNEIENFKKNIDKDIVDFWSFTDSSIKAKEIIDEYINIHLCKFSALVIEYVQLEKTKQDFFNLHNQIIKPNNGLPNSNRSDSKSANCYIATFAYSGIRKPEVFIYRIYRDVVLNKIFLGRVFIYFYYLLSPTLLALIKNMPYSQNLSKQFLDYYLKFKIIPQLTRAIIKGSCHSERTAGRAGWRE